MVDITWRNTKIVEGSNNMVIVPNVKLASATVTNYYQPDREIVVPVQVGVAYDNDLAAVERITLETARRVLREIPGGVQRFEPVLRYHTLGDTSVEFVVVLRARDVGDRELIKHEFIKQLHARYQANGIRFRPQPAGAAAYS